MKGIKIPGWRWWLSRVTDFFVALRSAGLASKGSGPDIGGSNKDIKPR